MNYRNASTVIASVALAALCSTTLLGSTVAPVEPTAMLVATTVVPAGQAVA